MKEIVDTLKFKGEKVNPKSSSPLTVRVVKYILGLKDVNTQSRAVYAIESGQLNPQNLSLYGYGQAMHKELCRWLGLKHSQPRCQCCKQNLPRVNKDLKRLSILS